MATLVLPIGQFLGKYFGAHTIAPESYDVRVGADVHNLSFDEYTVWSIAHGFPEMVGEKRPSRPIVEAQATQLGIAEPPRVFTRLVNSGLIAQIRLHRHMVLFAQNYRAYPLTVGLGNSAEDIGTFVLGHPGQPLALVSTEVFLFWSYLPIYPTLWDAAVETANDFAAEEGAEPITPDTILLSFLNALPTLLSMNCVYLDRS